jgi:hypothetical protein
LSFDGERKLPSLEKRGRGRFDSDINFPRNSVRVTAKSPLTPLYKKGGSKSRGINKR